MNLYILWHEYMNSWLILIFMILRNQGEKIHDNSMIHCYNNSFLWSFVDNDSIHRCSCLISTRQWNVMTYLCSEPALLDWSGSNDFWFLKSHEMVTISATIPAATRDSLTSMIQTNNLKLSQPQLRPFKGNILDPTVDLMDLINSSSAWMMLMISSDSWGDIHARMIWRRKQIKSSSERLNWLDFLSPASLCSCMCPSHAQCIALTRLLNLPTQVWLQVCTNQWSYIGYSNWKATESSEWQH